MKRAAYLGLEAGKGEGPEKGRSTFSWGPGAGKAADGEARPALA